MEVGEAKLNVFNVFKVYVLFVLILLFLNMYCILTTPTQFKFKCAFSGLIQLLATESFLKMTENAFYFTLNSFFLLKIFNFLPLFFCHVEKQLD